MADIVPQVIAPQATTVAYVAAAGGGDFITPNDGQVVFHVKNGGGAPITVTINPQVGTVPLPGIGSTTVPAGGGSVPNAGDRFFGPFAPGIWNDNNGKVPITYSGVTTVTVAAIKVPKP